MKAALFEQNIISRIGGFLGAIRIKVGIFAALFTGLLFLVLAAKQISPVHGLRGRYYANEAWSGSPILTAVDSNIRFERNTIAERTGFSDQSSIIWEGFVFVPKSSVYRFSISSDDGSWIYLDNEILINNGGIHPARNAEQEIFLSRGNHRLLIKYFDAGGQGDIDFRWNEIKTSKRLMPKLHLYPNPVSLGVFILDTVLPFLTSLFKAAFFVSGILLLLLAIRAVFPRWELLSVLSLCCFLIVAGLYGTDVLSKKSTAVSGCDSYSYVQGAELMARNGLFHTEFVDPLVPLIHEGYAKKPPDDKTEFLLSPHGHYVYDFQKGLIYNVFPPGMSVLLYPFVKFGGRTPVFYVLPFLNLIFLALFVVWGSKYVNVLFGICLSAVAFFNAHVFENTVWIMSDVPSMILIALSVFLLWRNLEAPRRYLPFIAGVCFGFSLMVRYSNLMGVFPLAYLFWLKFKANRRLKNLFKDLSLFSAGAFLFGIVPLALYTYRLFGTIFRLVYEPITQSRMQWANLGAGMSYYLNATLQTFGVLGVALMALGLGVCLARPKNRSIGFVCILGYLSFFAFYSFQSLRLERYLLPAFPFLAVLYGFGVLALAKKFDKSFIIKLLIVAFCVAYPFFHSKGRYHFGSVREEAVSLTLQKMIDANSVVFCDEMSGSLRFYTGIPGYRFIWTDAHTLQETIAILHEKKYSVYFLLDDKPAEDYFLSLLSQNTIPQEDARLIARIHGFPLYRYQGK